MRTAHVITMSDGTFSVSIYEWVPINWQAAATDPHHYINHGIWGAHIKDYVCTTKRSVRNVVHFWTGKQFTFHSAIQQGA